MDVVYLCRPGRRNEELRYSLRTLRNVPHDRVWIAGGWPTFVGNVTTVEVPRTGSRYAHTTASLIAAVNEPDLSDEFTLWNDDFFLLRPIAHMPVHYKGEIGLDLDRRTSNHYSRARLVVGDWLRAHGHTAFDYDLHLPLPMTKARVLEMAEMDLPDKAEVFTRTVYGNVHGIGGTQHPDVKVRQKNQPWDREGTYLSTSPSMFQHSSAGAFVREQFPDPSPYEVTHERRGTDEPGRHPSQADRGNPNGNGRQRAGVRGDHDHDVPRTEVGQRG